MRHAWNSPYLTRTPHMPLAPLGPLPPAYPAFPGYPGSPGGGPPFGFPPTPWSNLAVAQPPAGQAMPGQEEPVYDGYSSASLPAAEGTPLAGLAAHGVPVGYTPSGTPMLMAAPAGQLQMPPDLPGMPQMPGPPEGWLNGGLVGGGLLQPIPGVAPFDPSNLVQQYRQQGG